jgi:hypothetical protein
MLPEKGPVKDIILIGRVTGTREGTRSMLSVKGPVKDILGRVPSTREGTRSMLRDFLRIS